MKETTERDQVERVRERFTRSADAFVRLAVPLRARDTETIGRMAAVQSGEIALDLACGPGTFTVALASEARMVIGLDLTPALLERARLAAKSKGSGGIAFVCADATQLPCRAGSIDVAVCGYSFHHMSDPLLALRELARVLRPRGRLAVVDLIVPDGADADAHDRLERCRDSSHTHTLTAAEFRRMIEDAGFRIQSSERLERPRRFTDWMRIAGWEPTDLAWGATRRLMEAAFVDDVSGFRPRLVAGEGAAAPDIEFTQFCMFIGASKP